VPVVVPVLAVNETCALDFTMPKKAKVSKVKTAFLNNGFLWLYCLFILENLQN
jgi:hypothetical protein